MVGLAASRTGYRLQHLCDVDWIGFLEHGGITIALRNDRRAGARGECERHVARHQSIRNLKDRAAAESNIQQTVVDLLCRPQQSQGFFDRRGRSDVFAPTDRAAGPGISPPYAHPRRAGCGARSDRDPPWAASALREPSVMVIEQRGRAPMHSFLRPLLAATTLGHSSPQCCLRSVSVKNSSGRRMSNRGLHRWGVQLCR